MQLDPTHLDGLCQVDNTPAGLKTLLKALGKLQRKTGPTVHVLCESTGCYHRLLMDTLHKEGIRVSVLHASRVRSFAESLGKHAKTDAIDAQVLTLFGSKMEPEPTAPLSEARHQLQALTTRRTQLVDMQVMEKNRMEAHTLPELFKQAQHTLRYLQGQIDKLNKMIQGLLAKTQELQQQTERLCQMQGVGIVTATGLLVSLPELGSFGQAPNRVTSRPGATSTRKRQLQGQ